MATSVILCLYNSLTAQMCKVNKKQPVFKKNILRLTNEPNPLLLIGKRHFRTSNEGTLSCFIKSLLYYAEQRIMREISTERV